MKVRIPGTAQAQFGQQEFVRAIPRIRLVPTPNRQEPSFTNKQHHFLSYTLLLFIVTICLHTIDIDCDTSVQIVSTTLSACYEEIHCFWL